MKKALRIASGIGLILIGVVGLILPIMPGWVFLIPGLVILGDYFPPAKRLVDWLKARYAEARDAALGKKAAEMEEQFESVPSDKLQAAEFISELTGVEAHSILHEPETAKAACESAWELVQGDADLVDRFRSAKEALRV